LNGLKQQSQCVLITGASGGIGEALAFCFAKNGYKLVLVARNQNKLERVAEQCRQFSQQTPLIIVADLAQHDAAYTLYQQVKDANISVDILINNAGIGSWGNFAELQLQEHERVIQINLLAVVQLSRLFVTDMVLRRAGQIVNIASVYAYCPVPHQAIYAASKAFMLSFSGALANELHDSGVSITAICPGTTLTGFRKSVIGTEKSTMFTMSATEVAELTYTKIQQKVVVYTPGVINKLFVFITRLFPMRQLLATVNWLVYKVRGYKKLTDKT